MVYLYAFSLLFTPPMYSGAIGLTGILFVVLYGSTVKTRPLAWPLVCLILLALSTVLRLYVLKVDTGELVEGAKFFSMAACFWLGISLRVEIKNIQMLATCLLVVVFLWHVANTQVFQSIPFFYPPDFNNSVTLFVFLSILVLNDRGLLYRLLLITVLGVFSVIANSRLLLLVIPFFFLSQPVALSPRKILLMFAVLLSTLYFATQFQILNSFSDFARVEIFNAVMRVLGDRGFDLFGPGQTAFLYEVTKELPPVITLRLELQHAHNAILHVIGSYGLLSGLFFIAFFALLYNFSVKHHNQLLKIQLLILFALMMLETIISDLRAANIIMLFLGMEAAYSLTAKRTRAKFADGRLLSAHTTYRP